MRTALGDKTCTPCRGGVPPLKREQAEGVVQKWPVLGNTDNKNPAARQGWF
jgi:hypothetical protein